MTRLVLLGIMIGTTAILCALAVLVPASRPALFPENKIVENLTTFLYFATFLTAIYSAFRTKHKITYAFIALLGLFAFAEELSYGENIFDIHYDRAYGLDLSNAHNIIQLPYFMLKTHTTALDGLLTALIIAAAFAILFLSYCRSAIKLFFENHPPTRFIFIFFILAGGALVIDTGIAYHHYFPYVEELFELNASLALFFGAVHIPLNISQKIK